MANPNWLAVLAAFIVTTIAMPLVFIWLRRSRQEDHPNNRSLHQYPTVRGAGLALAIGILTAFAITGGVPWFFWLAVVGFTALGAFDDRSSLRPSTKLILQMLFTVPVALGIIHGLGIPIIVAFPVALFLLIVVNAVNFMDGVNGITGVHVFIWGIVYAIGMHLVNQNALITIALTLSAVGLAFLPWNVPKAQIFLGDSGSYLIGAYVGILAVLGVFAGQPIAFLAPLAIYGADTGFTLVRRLMRGDPVSQAHRDHVFQRLVLAGWGHVPTALITAVFTICASTLGLLSIQASLAESIMLVAGIVALCFVYLILPKIARRIGPRSHTDY